MDDLIQRFWSWLTHDDVPAPDPEWHEWLDRDLAFFRALSEEDKLKMLDLMAGFLDKVPIEGVRGFEITDEVRLTIAATACRLILHLDLSAYQDLTAVYVYPDRVLVHPASGERVLGVAHSHGAVVLSWPAVTKGIADPDDGHDTALHEFAHILDFGDGHANGAPPLRATEHYRSWAKVLSSSFRTQQGKRAVLRSYASTNPAEFFACATEAFFEQPAKLRRRAPELYAELARYYGWEPPHTR